MTLATLVRRLHATRARSAGVMDSLRSVYGNARDGYQKSKEAEVFRAQMDFLSTCERFGVAEFLAMTAKLREASGLSGMREKLPWVKNDPVYKDMQEQEHIASAMSPAQRASPPHALRGEDKRSIAEAAGKSVSDVNTLLGRVQRTSEMHEWVRRRLEQGLPLPQSQEQLELMLLDPHSGRKVRMQRGRRRRR